MHTESRDVLKRRKTNVTSKLSPLRIYSESRDVLKGRETLYTYYK